MHRYPPVDGRTSFCSLLVVVALVLAQQVPVLGGLLSLLLVLAGFGALTALVTGRATGQSTAIGKPGQAAGQSAG